MTKFCWICSKKFWGNRKYRIHIAEDGKTVEHFVHKFCAEQEGCGIVYPIEVNLNVGPATSKEIRYKNKARKL